LQGQIIEHLSEGVCLTRASDGVIVQTNPKLDLMYGFEPGELIGQAVSMINAPTQQGQGEATDEIMTLLQAQGEWHGEVLHSRKDGALFWCWANVSTFQHPEFGPVWISVHTDISERKEVERVKDDILSTVSHELRTPLSSLRGFVELMLARDYPAEKQRQFLTIIDHETKRLGRLIDDFLDIQRIESGRQEYQMTSMELHALLQEITDIYSQSHGDRQFHTEAPMDLPPVLGDRERLVQVMENLLANAVKFSAKGSQIRVMAQPSEQQVKVSVSDQGIGIAAQDIPHLFDKFFRVEQPRANRRPGTGLGLSLVQEIIKAHGGEVVVESEPGKGTRFSFTLARA
jgi:PAS domain S-box-containing protein